MRDDLQLIRTFFSEAEARLAVDVLENQSITSVLKTNGTGGATIERDTTAGSVDLFVLKTDYGSAKHLLGDIGLL